VSDACSAHTCSPCARPPGRLFDRSVMLLLCAEQCFPAVVAHG
jgi:hypothetical protein